MQCLLESPLASPPCSPCRHNRFNHIYSISKCSGNKQTTKPSHNHDPYNSLFSHICDIWLCTVTLHNDLKGEMGCFGEKRFFFALALENSPLIWIYLQAGSVWWGIPAQKSWKDFLTCSLRTNAHSTHPHISSAHFCQLPKACLQKHLTPSSDHQTFFSCRHPSTIPCPLSPIPRQLMCGLG